MDTENRQTEKEILSAVKKKTAEAKTSEWLPAGFGEREKQLRMKHKLSQQEVADKLGTSVSTISRLENGQSQTIDIDVLSGMADLYKTSVDFLLGKIRTPERLYFSLKDIGLTPEAGLALYSGKADVPTVNKLLENEKFQGLTYAVKDYLAFTPGADGRPVRLLIEMSSDSKFKRMADSYATKQPARLNKLLNLMKGYYEQGSVDALGNGLKTAVKEIRRNNGSYIKDGVKLSVEMFQMMKELYPNDGKIPAEIYNTPEYITERILDLFAPNGQLPETTREFLAAFRNSLISMNLEDDEIDDTGIQ